MVTKARVESIISPYKVKVRIPFFESSENTKSTDLNYPVSDASICCLANTLHSVDIGDIVYVAFEDNDIGRPVIIGHLSRDQILNNRSSLDIADLKVSGNTYLKSADIGDIKNSEINCLSGVKHNLQTQLNYITDNFSKKESWHIYPENTLYSDNTQPGQYQIDLSNLNDWIENNFYDILIIVEATSSQSSALILSTDLVSNTLKTYQFSTNNNNLNNIYYLPASRYINISITDNALDSLNIQIRGLKKYS